MPRTARHRADARPSDVAIAAAGSALAHARGSFEDAAVRMRRSSWPRRALIAVSASGLALSLIGLHDVSAMAAPVAAAPEVARVVATTPVPEPAPVQYTAPASTPVVAPARDGYGITILPPPETPDRVSWPVPSSTPISSPFGPRIAPCPTCSTDHHGVDLVPGEGTPVAAMASGVVVEAAEDGELGVHVVIRHTIRGHTVESVYGHLLAGSMPLAVGDHVARAQQIGLVGNTGESTGPHLHFGVFVDGQAIDPIAWMAANADH